ncbi:hypothetical protein CCAX7_35560 [Capsulimonas corticalis]|uniref:Uncharacterized protein n=1 Tax=Capsulimonas corticalis TaxID=2219043 RepID=A0A9N7QBN8_9BACT|nr:hypothetical protein CCAX7_35560 [Capsulimonas corticalis]
MEKIEREERSIGSYMLTGAYGLGTVNRREEQRRQAEQQRLCPYPGRPVSGVACELPDEKIGGGRDKRYRREIRASDPQQRAGAEHEPERKERRDPAEERDGDQEEITVKTLMRPFEEDERAKARE